MLPLSSQATVPEASALKSRLQSTFALSSTRYSSMNSPESHAVNTTAPPVGQNDVVGGIPAQEMLPTLELDFTEPSGPHAQTCQLSIGEPAPVHFATPSNPATPGIRVRVDWIRPSGDPDEENVDQSS